MARFNTAVEAKTKTTNLAGGPAYTQSPELELVSILLTSFVQDQFYRSAKDTMARVRQLVGDLRDKKFAAQAAVYARNEFGMRSISHVTAGEIAVQVKGEDWTAPFFKSVVRRPDDVTEILSYVMAQTGNKTIPNALKRGLAAALEGFDAYQLAKYKASGKSVSLIDAVRLTHPQATDAITALVRGTLKPADTWETQMTQAGQKAETDEDKEALKAEVWRSLVESRKIGQFALLRNLRNIVEQAPDLVASAAELLKDPKRIHGSLIFPFRYLTAYRTLEEVRGSKVMLAAVAEATHVALDNVPEFSGRSLVAIDTSGSMQSVGFGQKSIVSPVDVAIVFGVAMAHKGDTDVAIFADDTKFVSVDPTVNVMATAQAFRKRIGEVGHGTAFPTIFGRAKEKYDRIFIFSDMQTWSHGGYWSPDPTDALKAYRTRTGANPHVYAVDLAGHGTTQFPPDRRYQLAGFSEKIFDLMGVLEQDRDALVNKIRQVTFN